MSPRSIKEEFGLTDREFNSAIKGLTRENEVKILTGGLVVMK